MLPSLAACPFCHACGFLLFDTGVVQQCQAVAARNRSLCQRKCEQASRRKQERPDYKEGCRLHYSQGTFSYDFFVNLCLAEPCNCFTALFLGPPGWAGARRGLLDSMVQGKINRGRHTDHPAVCHSIRTKQCPPPSFPMFFFYRTSVVFLCCHLRCFENVLEVLPAALPQTIVLMLC